LAARASNSAKFRRRKSSAVFVAFAIAADLLAAGFA
jgi:hypothetical protein